MVAIGLTGVRLLLTGVESFKPELEQHLSELLEAPVQIGQLKAGMHGLTPGFIAQNIKIENENEDLKPAIKMAEIRLNLDLWSLATTRELWESFWLTLVGAELEVIQHEDGQIRIAGLNANADAQQPLWLLQGKKFEVLKSRVTWQNRLRKGKALAFDQVDLVLKNIPETEQHELHVLMQLPPSYGEVLRVSMQLKGNVFAAAGVSGKIYAEGKNIQLSELVTAELPSGFKVSSGVGDFKLWSEWHQNQLIAATGSLYLINPGLSRNGHAVFQSGLLSTGFNFMQRQNLWQLDINDLSIDKSVEPQQKMQFSIKAELDVNKALHKVGLAVKYMDLQQAAEIAVLSGLLSDESAKLLKKKKPKGQLSDAFLFADFTRGYFNLAGDFTRLSINGDDKIPGFTELAGAIKGNSRSGLLTLNSEQSQLQFNGLFERPFEFSRIHGQVEWLQNVNEWIFTGSKLEVDTPDFPVLSRFKYIAPKNESPPFLDLQSSFEVSDVSRIAHYLPVKVMSKNSIDWLSRAFVKGRVEKGEMLFYGRPDEFPFIKNQGVFEVDFGLAQAELDYNKNWPSVTNLSAQLHFKGESLTARVSAAEAGKCLVQNTKVEIPSFERSRHVLIDGQLAGSIANFLEFLQKTPIAESVNALLGAVEPKGDSRVVLKLKIPLVNHADVAVDGVARLNNARLNVLAFDLPVQSITGDLKFNQSGLYADHIKANALGNPIRVNIASNSQQTDIDVEGHVGIAELKQQFKLPGWSIAQGSTDYKLALTLPYSERQHSMLTFNSNLQGVRLDLPEQLAKSEFQKKPITLKFDLNDSDLLPVRLTYADLLKAAVKFDVQRQSLHSGEFLVGSGHVQFPAHKIIRFIANLDTLRLEDWLLIGREQTDNGGALVDAVTIHTRHLLNKSKDLGPLRLELKRDGHQWTGEIDSAGFKGKLKIPVDLTKDQGIALNLDLINLSALKEMELDWGHKQNQLFPLISVNSKKTMWRSVDLGALELRTKRIPEGLYFNRFELVGRQKQLSLTGSWKINGQQTKTEVQGYFESKRFGNTLRELGFYEEMKETQAFTNFAFNWQGAPHQVTMTNLKGDVDLKLKEGRLLSIEPGIGRVLGVLAFSQWLRRLQLDFRDVFKEGLTFTSIKGKINVSNGLAKTDNLTINAVPAKIKLSGTADLLNKTLDQSVTVVPKSSDAVPIAGTIVGRIAGMVADAVTDDYKEGYFFGSVYQIKGSWANPQLIPVHENDGLINKTWQGIMDFPWLAN